MPWVGLSGLPREPRPRSRARYPPGTMTNPLDLLAERGFVQDVTDPDELRRLLGSERVTFYYGADPTATALPIGNLVGIMAMAWLPRSGHRPIALPGGG